MGKVHCLASYKVAAWQRDLDTPPWKSEGEKSTHTCKQGVPTLGYHQLIHENTEAKPNASAVYVSRAQHEL